MKTFPMGGVHPSENKLSCAKPIEVLPLPEVVTIPLAQHIGAPAVAKVAKGDKVLTGQLIAEAGSFMSANIHSPVSGTVTAVDMAVNGQGLRQMMITIKREGDDWAEGIDRSDALVKVCPFSAQEIVAKIKDAGIVGMGGATFPTHVKLSVPPGKKADVVIINGVECEPYLTSDHRTMLEHGEELIVGVTILMKAVGVQKACIGIENNKPDAIAHLRQIAAGYAGIEIVPLKVMYPQGGEKQLIAAVTGRQVPPPPALPIDVGAVVCNASTAFAVYQAVLKNKPLIERVVTVTGKSLKEPKNLLTRMGTPVSALLEAAGGLPEDARKVINGGPMMGRAMVNLDSPVTKGCSGITVMSGRDAQRREASQCIKCAKCVSACPMGLEPYYLSKMTQKKGWDELEALMITSCIECGCCQSTCPAYLPLLDWVRLGKQTVMGLIRARAAAAPKK
ncbi:electron transport complex subunit RsxC [Alistipes sp. kh20]|uniref:electron transport complex subunit RsxC n=1 Tax=Alistipes TaxID=239759 RepID=UPI00189B506E|nr:MULTISPECIES: electron transport complex subunit RsxC [Alistipes]MBS4766922.1 electron transport complex subunit RsxC [Alistipes montrealensis]